MSSRVSHPSHYNHHPNGIETIDIIRHYTCDTANALKYLMRAGHKTEKGMTREEKEVEDLKKALWYIKDCYKTMTRLPMSSFKTPQRMDEIILEVTGHRKDEIACCGYDDNVAIAIGKMLNIGIIRHGSFCVSTILGQDIKEAEQAIQARIRDITNARKNDTET